MKTSRTRPLRRAKSAAAIEPLEDRIAPASTVTLTAGGDITVIDGANLSDTITISLVGANLHFFDPSGIIAGSGATQLGANNVEVPASGLTGKLIVNTSSQPVDRVTFASGLPLLTGVQVMTQAITPLPALIIGTNGLDLTATQGPIIITGSIDAQSSVSLHSGNAIGTQPTGLVSAPNIDATAVNGINLRMDAGFITAQNTNNGGITLTESNTVLISNLNSGPGGLTLQSGSFQIGAGGVIGGGNKLTVNGTLDLNGSSQGVGSVTGNGTITNSAAALVNFTLGVDNQDGNFTGSIGGPIIVVKLGNATQTFSGPQSYNTLNTSSGTMILNTPLVNATINNNAGTLILNAGAPGSVVNVNGMTIFGGGLQLGALNISNNGFAQMAPHAGGGLPFVLDTQLLTIASGGKLDLANNAMIVRGGDLAFITTQLASGFNVAGGGYWDGTGINSSAAAFDPQGVTALGVIDNNDFGYANFVGVPVSSTGHDVIIRHTYYGDADLNGVVNGTDYALADLGRNTPGAKGWSNGDFDYNNLINNDDATLQDFGYGQQAVVPGGVIHVWQGVVSSDWFDPANWTNGVPTASDTAVLGNPNGFQPQIDTNAVVAFWDQSAGTLSGIGSLNVGIAMTWLGGSEIGGTTFLGPGASLTLGGSTPKLLDGRMLTLPANTVSNAAGSLQLNNNAILVAQGSLSLSHQFTLLPGNATLDTTGFDVTFATDSAIDGSGGLTKVGGGTLILNSTNTYGGVTNVLEGTLTAGATNKLSPNSNIIVAGGTLALGSFDQAVAGVVLNTGSITATIGKLTGTNFQLNGGTDFADLISTGPLMISGSAVFANLDAGAPGGGGGLIQLDAGSVTPRSSYSTASEFAVTGGVLDVGAFTVQAGAFNILGGNVNASTGAIYGVGLVSIATGSVNANVISDNQINVSSGTVNGNVDAGNGAINLSGGAVFLKSGATTNSTLNVSGGVLNIASFSPTFANVNLTSGAVNGTTGALTATTAINVIGSGATVAANLAAPTGTILVIGDALLTLQSADLVANSLQVSGSGSSVNLGAFNAIVGSVSLGGGQINGTGTVFASTTFSMNGNSAVMNANLSAAGATVNVLDGATLMGQTSNLLANNLNVDGNGSQVLLGTFDAVLTGTAAITGNASITADLISATGITIDGTVNANLNAGAGTIDLLGGTVTIHATNTIASTLHILNGVFDLTTFNQTVGAFIMEGGSVAGTGTLSSASAFDMRNGTITAHLGGGVALVKTTSGVVVLANSNTYTGGTLIAGGTIVISNPLAGGTGLIDVGDGATLTTVNGGIIPNNIKLSGGNGASGVGALRNGGSPTPTVFTGTVLLSSGNSAIGTDGGDITLNGIVSGPGTFTKISPGTLFLKNKNNTFGPGTVVVDGGTLQIAGNGSLGNAANDIVLNGAVLQTTSSFTLTHMITGSGINPTINVAGGTLTLGGPVAGVPLVKAGPGVLLFGPAAVGNAVIPAGSGAVTVGGSKVLLTGVGSVTITIVSDGMGGTRISTVELADTNATTILAINGPKAPATLTIDKILSLDPADEIGTIKLGKTVIVGDGLDDGIADIDIRGKVGKLLFNDVNSYCIFELGKGLPYDVPTDDTTPDSYNNHPDIKLRNVLGPGVTLDLSNNGIAGDQPGSIGGGGLGKVIVNLWDQPGTVKTTQSIGQFKFKHGDCNVVFLVDPDHLGALTTAGIGKMLIPNGAWGSSGSIVEGNVTVFSAAQFLAAASITAGSMSKLLVKKGPYLGTTTLKDPDAAKMGTFSVNGDFQGYVDSAQALSNLNIKGTFKGSIKAKSIGSIAAYSFNGTTTGDGEGDPLRHNIFVTDGSLGTIKTSAGGIKDFEIAVATVFNGFYIQWPTAPGGAVGINNVTVAAGQINNTTVNLAAGVPNALSYGIKDSVFESAGSLGNLVSSHSVSNSIFAAVTTIGKVTFNADLLGSKLLAGTSLGGDGVFDGDETYTRAGKIGDVKALGTFGTTTIAVGIDPGAGFIYGDGDDTAAPGFATPKALGALTFGAASGGIFGPAGIVHTDAIMAATIKSLKVGSNPILKVFTTSHYIRAGIAEAASDVLVQIV